MLRACRRLPLLALHILSGVVMTLSMRLRYGKRWFDTEQGTQAIQTWMQRACSILAIRMLVKGVPSVVQDTLFVANHVSWLDIIALSTVMPTKFIAKDSVQRWPLIGRLATATGTLFIKRGKYFAVNQVIETARDELQRGHSILLFPEGTTTDGEHVARFHAALFKTVSDSSHFVQAIALRYKRHGQLDRFAPYIGKDNFVMHLFRIATLAETCLELVFMPPFQAVNMSRHDIAALTHNVVRDCLRGEPSWGMFGERFVA